MSVDDESVEEFKKEAMLLLNLRFALYWPFQLASGTESFLRPHPNIVQMLGVSVKQGNTYMILELCVKYESLLRFIRFISELSLQRGSLLSHFGKGDISFDQKLVILKQCGLGIAHLHKEVQTTQHFPLVARYNSSDLLQPISANYSQRHFGS